MGRLPQVPGVFSQGATLEELEENVRDAYRMMIEEQETGPAVRLVKGASGEAGLREILVI